MNTAKLNKLTLKTVAENSMLSTSLIRSLVRWHGGWDEFKAIAEDIDDHGADCGNSFIYYTDSTKFFRSHAKDLKWFIKKVQENYYCDSSISAMIHSWKCVGDYYTEDEINTALYCGKGDAVDTVFCVVCRCAVEELARNIVDCVENDY